MLGKILFVEDDNIIIDLYKRPLEEEGFQVECYSTGQQGIMALQTIHYDLIILDVMLPEVNGIEVLKKIKENEKTAHIPVLMLSNMDQPEIIEQTKQLGAAGYYIKSANNPKKLNEEVKKALENHSKS